MELSFNIFLDNTPVLQYRKEYLYVGKQDSLLLIVPYQIDKKFGEFLLWTFLRQSPLVNVWTIAILLLTGARKCIWPKHNLIALFFETFGISFGMTSSKPGRNRSENILLFFISIFAMLSGILCSGIIFQQLTVSTYSPAIQSIENLEQYPHIDIITPISLNALVQLHLLGKYS